MPRKYSISTDECKRPPAPPENVLGRICLERALDGEEMTPLRSALSALGFGGAPVGNLFAAVSDVDGASAIDTAWAGDVRYFDTAPHYGLGLSERRIGAALAQHPRDEYLVSTKVGRRLVTNAQPTGSDLGVGGFAVADDLTRVFDYSWSGVRQSLGESLTRLGLDYVDIVYVHDPDDFMDEVIREALPSLAELRDEGVIGAIGAGMNDWRPLLQLVEACDVDVVMLAGRWTLLDQSGLPLLDACADRGVAVVAAAPFNSGVLAHSIPTSEHTFNYQRVSPALLAKAQTLAAISARYDVELPCVALQFPIRHKAVESVVVGMRSAEEARDDVEWMRQPVPIDLWAEIAEFEASWSDTW
jgi:D-threo-aldose 1-dehydrogenase